MPIFDKWILPDAPAPSSPVAGLPDQIAAILSARGVVDQESYRRFTAPTLDDLHDGRSIHGISAACDRIGEAIRAGESILIYGDYDVDGVTSIVMLQTVIRAIGGKVSFVVPHRVIDGYGLKIEVIERVLADQKVALVITVDCGISSVEPVEAALARGIDVIVTDHHLPPGVLPDAVAVVNPKQDGCSYPYKELAGVGVAFKLACELLRRSQRKMSTESLLKIAAIGTIADVAPLTGENRTIAQIGLAGLGESRNRGLRALIRSVGLQGRTVRASDVGFKIGPRLNAAGRLHSADSAVQLFAAATDDAAFGIVAELNRLNDERRAVERQVLAAALAQLDEQGPCGNVIVAAGEGWHRGVVGLVAGKLCRLRNRPALVLSIDGEVAVGSGRSIERVDLHSRLVRVADLFTHFGGHRLACGFSLPAKRLGELRARIAGAFEDAGGDALDRCTEVDGTVRLGDLDAGFLAAYAALEPFGAGNRQPVLLCRDVVARRERQFAPDCRAYELDDGTGTFDAVLWPSNAAVAATLGERAADVLLRIDPDSWSSRGYRAEVVDACRSGDAPVRNESTATAV